MELNPSTEQAIRSLITEVLPEAFVVEIALKTGRSSVLSVLVDTDAGISIDQCTRISRRLGRWIDEDNPLDFAFNLEVSSPGVGKPLRMYRQYIKEKGRRIKVTTLDNQMHRGVLQDVTEEYVLLAPPPKNLNPKQKQKAKETPAELKIPFSDIKEAKVEISFG